MSATHNFAGIAANNDIKTVDAFAPQSWEDCDGFARSHHPDEVNFMYQRWEIGSNVALEWDGEEEVFGIVLYDTEVVRYYQDGTLSVDNGGFSTITTMRRVNQFAPDGAQFWHDDKVLVLVHCEEFGLEPTHRRHGSGMLRCDHSVRIPCKRVA